MHSEVLSLVYTTVIGRIGAHLRPQPRNYGMVAQNRNAVSGVDTDGMLFSSVLRQQQLLCPLDWA